MKVVVGLLFATSLSPAVAGALQDCAGDARVVKCLERAREVAGEQMLERFLEVQQGLAALGGRRAEQATDLLKQSQRAFERYLAEQCHGLEAMVAQGAATALACETDLLRQRATKLEAIDLGAMKL